MRGEHVADVDNDERRDDATDDAGGGAFPGLSGAEARGEFVLSEGTANVERGYISGPDANHQEDDQRGSVFLLPDKGDKSERIGDVDKAEESLSSVGQHLDKGRAETVPGEECQRERAEHRKLRLDGKVGKGVDEGKRCAESHTPERDAELSAMGFGIDGGELEVLVDGKLSDDGREEGDHT